jgi:hypothetical protein
MIFDCPEPQAPLDQGDIIDSCPIVRIAAFDPLDPDSPDVQSSLERVVVLTQTCDLLQSKVSRVVVAVAIDASTVIAEGLLKASDIRGPDRSGRVYGWHFLPASTDVGLPELIIDLRQVDTVPLDLLQQLCRDGHRNARLRPLFREHLAKHFGDTYSRIGLPEPYATE